MEGKISKIINEERVESKLLVFKIHSIHIKDKVIPYCKARSDQASVRFSIDFYV